MRKLRIRKIRLPVQGHEASKWRPGDESRQGLFDVEIHMHLLFDSDLCLVDLVLCDLT